MTITFSELEYFNNRETVQYIEQSPYTRRELGESPLFFEEKFMRLNFHRREFNYYSEI